MDFYKDFGFLFLKNPQEGLKFQGIKMALPIAFYVNMKVYNYKLAFIKTFNFHNFPKQKKT